MDSRPSVLIIDDESGILESLTILLRSEGFTPVTAHGGKRGLDVDAVLLIIEHGDYPVNPFGQILYPRYELFEEIVQVFRRSGRSVPVFCDKALSYDHRLAVKMVATTAGDYVNLATAATA